MYRLGIDLGGTKTEGVILDDNNVECFRKRIPTAQEKGYDGVLAGIRTLLDLMVKRIRGAEYTFGIGTPGAVSPVTGLLSLSNTTCLNGKPVKQDLETLLGRPIGIQNDANCFAMAEAMLGAGRGKDLVFGIIMGTGCGGGIVYKGQVISGLHIRGGEWGHMSIDPNGPECFCGRKGCVETFISGGGLEKRYEERFGTRLPLRRIERDYYGGKQEAIDFVRDFFRNFGRAVANLITVLDPDIIVIGGGVSNFDALYTEGRAEISNCILGDQLRTPVVKHQLGDSAGVLGAALIGV